MTKLDGRNVAVTGVVPPQRAEAIIRETFPGVTDVPILPAIAKLLARSVILAPLAWVPLALCYGKRLTPGITKRYTLTNKRLMLQRGFKPSPTQEISLVDIKDVTLDESSYDSYYRTADLYVINKSDQKVMRLESVPEPEAFRRTILQAKESWAANSAS